MDFENKELVDGPNSPAPTNLALSFLGLNCPVVFPTILILTIPF